VTDTFRLLITGSRQWPDENAVWAWDEPGLFEIEEVR
jgi:hypothetical protein